MTEYRKELRLTLGLAYLAQNGDVVPVVLEEADCADVFALAHELDDVGLALERFRAAISEAFLNGTREIKALVAG